MARSSEIFLEEDHLRSTASKIGPIFAQWFSRRSKGEKLRHSWHFPLCQELYYLHNSASYFYERDISKEFINKKHKSKSDVKSTLSLSLCTNTRNIHFCTLGHLVQNQGTTSAKDNCVVETILSRWMMATQVDSSQLYMIVKVSGGLKNHQSKFSLLLEHGR